MRNRKGFTLMEVVVGMAIVAIVSIPLLQMFVTSTKVGRYSYDTDKANSIVLETVEQIKSGTMPVTFDSAGNFAQASYFSYDWGMAGSSNYAFRMDVLVTGSVSNAMQSSYIPQFVDSSSGSPYSVTIDYGVLPAANYTLTLTQTGTNYQLACNAAILSCKGVASSTVVIPKADIASSVFPVAVDDTVNTLNPVKFEVSSDADVQLGLYVFGDDAASPLVTMKLAGGNASITTLSADVSSLSYDKMTIHVTVKRADGSVIADYTTMGYNVATASGVM